MGCNESKNVKLAPPQRLQPRKLARRNVKHNEFTLQHHNRVSPLRHVPSTQRATEESDSPLPLQSTRANRLYEESFTKGHVTTSSNYVSDKAYEEENDNNPYVEHETGNYSELSTNAEHSNKHMNVEGSNLEKRNQYQSINSIEESNRIKSDVRSEKNVSNCKLVNPNINTISSAVGLQESSVDGEDDATSSQNSEESVLSLSSFELSGSFRSPVLMLDNGDCRLESAGVMQPSDLMIANSKMAKLRVRTSNRTHSPNSNDAELLLVCVDCGREINDEDDNCICPLTGKLH